MGCIGMHLGCTWDKIGLPYSHLEKQKRDCIPSCIPRAKLHWDEKPAIGMLHPGIQVLSKACLEGRWERWCVKKGAPSVKVELRIGQSSGAFR